MGLRVHDKQGRATSVHSAAILDALNNVYGAKDLARELVNGHSAVVLLP